MIIKWEKFHGHFSGIAESTVKFFTFIVLVMAALPVLADNNCVSCHGQSPLDKVTDSCMERRNDFLCTSCHGGIAGTSRKDLAHYRLTAGKYADFMAESPTVTRGGSLIEEVSCRRCHTVDGRGTRLASNLDVTIKRLTAQEIEDNIATPNEQMPAFNFSPEESAAIVTALLHYSSKKNAGDSLVEIVHFGGDDKTRIYEDKCGGCHRMLSGSGALGQHTLAPFLSGLYSEFYPLLAGKGWEEKRLSDWLENPRRVKPNAVMPVPGLSPEEKDAVLQIFSEIKL